MGARLANLHDCPAPAKLNLFLHVVGRRADGYHLLQSVFQLIDLADRLHFSLRNDGQIVRTTDVPDVPADTDLTVRAARRLQAFGASIGHSRLGVEIAVEKNIPMGGGLGGGSSDAATTLLALNRLWGLELKRPELMRLGLELGADVPFFIFGQNAYVAGIGEQLMALATTPLWFAVVHPGVSVPTAAIFGAPELTRDTKALKISDFSAAADVSAGVSQGTHESRLYTGIQTGDGTTPVTMFGHNDLEPVALDRYPAVGQALDWLRPYGPVRMSGSGACVFCPVTSAAAARQALGKLPETWSGWVCQANAQHPLRDWVQD